MERWGQFVLTSAMFATIVLVAYFMFDMIKKGMYQVAAQMGQIASSCMRMGG